MFGADERTKRRLDGEDCQRELDVITCSAAAVDQRAVVRVGTELNSVHRVVTIQHLQRHLASATEARGERIHHTQRRRVLVEPVLKQHDIWWHQRFAIH